MFFCQSIYIAFQKFGRSKLLIFQIKKSQDTSKHRLTLCSNIPWLSGDLLRIPISSVIWYYNLFMKSMSCSSWRPDNFCCQIIIVKLNKFPTVWTWMWSTSMGTDSNTSFILRATRIWNHINKFFRTTTNHITKTSFLLCVLLISN